MTVSQLRTALEENEGYFDILQQAHDDLASHLAELETEHAEMLIERAADAQTLQDAHENVRALEDRVKRYEIDRSKAEVAIVELQQQLHHVEGCLDSEREEKKRALGEIEEINNQLEKRNERVAEVEDLLRAGIEREGEIARLNAIIKVKDGRIIELQSRQTARQKSLDSSNEMIAERDSTIASFKYSLEAAESEAKKLEKENLAAVKSIAAKDMIIGVLRDKLSTTNFEKDELIAKSQLDSTKLGESQIRLKTMEEEMTSLIARTEEANAEVQRLECQLTGTMRRIGDVAVQERQALEATEQLEAERKEWEDERVNVSLLR